MSKPKIAVCRNNHVYNAALYTECPICLKKRTFGGASAAVTGRIPGSYAYDHGGGDPEDRTVNLFDSTVDNRNVHVSESSRRGPASVSTGSHSLSGPSVRSYSSSSSSRKPRQRCLAGWLVFLSGKDFGMSLQLMEGQNFISMDEKGYAKVTREPQKSLDCFACITVTSDNRFLAAPFRRSDIRINEKTVSVNQEIRERHILRYRDCEMMFIPFAGVHYNWT